MARESEALHLLKGFLHVTLARSAKRKGYQNGRARSFTPKQMEAAIENDADLKGQWEDPPKNVRVYQTQRRHSSELCRHVRA